ncbi:hypothetical protein [Myroides sp. WP-1]|uniref:hypothetical protein n=1 Tax=Myroides sp. WP-1 TaxID=2759944 RepID=UPI0015FBDE95|nr:hypothetical protein [Myroides sp. WP-1]MBB1140722.1 hypothetical protein [Myroides sp. WP-1]
MRSIYLIIFIFLYTLNTTYSQNKDLNASVLELKYKQIESDAEHKTILDKVDTLNSANDKIITVFYSSLALIIASLVGVNLYSAYDHRKYIKRELEKLSNELDRKFEEEKNKNLKIFQNNLNKVADDVHYKWLLTKLKRHPENEFIDSEMNRLLELVRITPYSSNYNESDTIETVDRYFLNQKEIFTQKDVDEIIDILKREYSSFNSVHKLILKLKTFEKV